jgi:hypothetical protein
MTKKPAEPTGLGLSGKRLWRDVVAGWDLRPDELVVLERACRVRDRLAMLDAALAKVSVVDGGSRGQERVHPLVGELRQTEVVLAGLLDRLRLTDPSEGIGVGGTRSTAARALAMQRWGRQ